MIEITERATKLLLEHFQNKKRRPIRLFVKLGGCGIRSFGIALEKPQETDEIFEIEGFQYIIDKKLLKNVEPIKVDSDGFGFRISGSGIAHQHGCGNCGFACGDGNRCTADCTNCTHRCGHGIRLMKKLNSAP
jgi:iron-sulfur cluster assembly protein